MQQTINPIESLTKSNQVCSSICCIIILLVSNQQSLHPAVHSTHTQVLVVRDKQISLIFWDTVALRNVY